jgi:Holliday junction DNA helicase RuvA
VIGSLRGILLDRVAKAGGVEVLIEVAGVGYRATVPTGAAVALGELGSPVFLHVHTHVREDAIVLFGFATREERRCFEALIGAHGVGPAMAMAILSVHRPEALREIVASDDSDALSLVPGIGKKTAVKLLLELKSRLDLPMLDPVPAYPSTPRSEVRDALAALGYGGDEIREATRDLPADGDVKLLLKLALGRMVKASV